MSDHQTLIRILELARWAPSGDNTQPWRFEIANDRCVLVHGFDTRRHCVYDLDGHASQLSHGALIETAAIAASAHGLRTKARRWPESAEERPVYELRFEPDSALQSDTLVSVIEQRSVQRRPMSTRRLGEAAKQALGAAAGAHYEVVWLEDWGAKWRVARLLFDSAKLRLTMPEAYAVHREVIEWHARYSTTKVPDQALGVGAATLRLMQFAMHSWERVEFFNRYLAGTWLPRLQMDVLPALACGAHFVLVARNPPSAIDDYVEAGRATQRFWLAATQHGLQMQPAVTPLVFARYAAERRPFARSSRHLEQASQVEGALTSLLGSAKRARSAVFMGRLGQARPIDARSLRLDVDALLGPLPTSESG